MPNRLTETLDAFPFEESPALSVKIEIMLTGLDSFRVGDGKWLNLFKFSLSDHDEENWRSNFILFACVCAQVDDETLDAIIEAIKTGEI